MGAPSSSLDALWQDLEAHTAGKPLVKAAAMHQLQQVSDLLQAGSQLHWPSVRTCIAMLCRTDDAALIGRLVTGWSVQEFHWMLHTCNLFTGEGRPGCGGPVCLLHWLLGVCPRVQVPAYLPTAAHLGQGSATKAIFCASPASCCVCSSCSQPQGQAEAAQSWREAVRSRPLVCVSLCPAPACSPQGPCALPAMPQLHGGQAGTLWHFNGDLAVPKQAGGC